MPIITVGMPSFCYAFADSRFTVQETAMMNDVKITNCIMVNVVFWVGLLNYFSRF